MPATEPAELHLLFTAAVNDKDADALLALYEPSGTAVRLDGSTSTGEPELRTMIDQLLSMIEHIDGQTRKVISNGDVALTSASWRARLVTADGSHEASGTTAEIARRQPDGSWRWVIDDPSFG